MNALLPPRPLDMMWFLPTGGDGRYLSSAQGARPVDNRYLRQIAQATDQFGYHGVLLPTGAGCEDALVTATSLLPFTERLRFLVALRPGLTLPGEAARQHSALDRIGGGWRQAAVPAGAGAASADLLRRLLAGRAHAGGGAGRHLPDLG